MIYQLLEEALKDEILYNAPVDIQIDNNLLTIKVNGLIFQFDFMNGKIEKVYVNGSNIQLPISEKFKLTILIMS